MVKKKGILHYVWKFITFLFDLLVSFLKFLWKGIIWLLSTLYSSMVKKSEKVVIESKKPKAAASFSGFSELESSQGELANFEKELYSGKSLIGLVLGARGSGKTAIGVRILENAHAKTNLPIYSMGLSTSSIPSWIKPIENLSEVQNHSFILVDEGGIEFSSRNSMSDANKLLGELLLISRHKDLSVLFITQNSANIDINTIRQVDYMLLKTPSLLQLDFERKKIGDIYEKAKAGFEKYKRELGLTYIYAHNYLGFVKCELPSFWSTNLSKSYAKK